MSDNSFEAMFERIAENAASRALEKFTANYFPKEVVPIPAIKEDEEFTISEQALYLKCSAVTIHARKKAGQLPYYQIGRVVRFRRSEIDQAMSVPVAYKTVRK